MWMHAKLIKKKEKNAFSVVYLSISFVIANFFLFFFRNIKTKLNSKSFLVVRFEYNFILGMILIKFHNHRDDYVCRVHIEWNHNIIEWKNFNEIEIYDLLGASSDFVHKMWWNGFLHSVSLIHSRYSKKKGCNSFTVGHSPRGKNVCRKA